MKKGNNGKNEQIADPFSFLSDQKIMDDAKIVKDKPDSTEVTQGDFDDKAGNKLEVFNFLSTRNFLALISSENIFLPKYAIANMDYLGGIMDDAKS